MGQLATAGIPDPRRLVPRTDAVLADPGWLRPLARLGAQPWSSRRSARPRSVPARARSPPTPSPTRRSPHSPRRATSLRPVLNATGVVLHTNLGRAPLSAVGARGDGRPPPAYVDVEFDVETGARARRGRGTLAALREAVPAAGDVLVVNNGAAALCSPRPRSRPGGRSSSAGVRWSRSVTASACPT